MKNSKSMIILLVGLAVLTLVVVVGLVLFYPKEPAKTAAAPAATTAAPVPDSFDPVEWGRDPQTPGLQPAAPAAGDQGVTVTLPQPATGLPASPGATFPGDAPAATPATPATVTSKPAGTPAPAAPVVTTAPAPAKAAPAPVKAPPAKTVKTAKVTEFWIQVASFKDRYQAENTAKSLETQGLKGTLSTASVNGQAVVRVRVGPYANEAEAKKFLAWLTPVKEFSASYVTKVSATRPVN